jgi:3-methyladenine DNA glycosylase AlkD
VRPPPPKAIAGRLLAALRAAGTPENVAGMARFGIAAKRAIGVPVPRLRALAREARLHRDPRVRHAVAARLWASGVHEARILATMVDEPALVSAAQAERWIRDVDSWDVCDQLCNNLLRQAPPALALARAWPSRRPEFTRRAGLVLLAVRAVHDREVPDAELGACLVACEAAAADPRTYVKKAVSWALRQVGKRSEPLRQASLLASDRIRGQGTPQARWIASDVARELRDPGTLARMRSRASGRGGRRSPPARRA